MGSWSTTEPSGVTWVGTVGPISTNAVSYWQTRCTWSFARIGRTIYVRAFIEGRTPNSNTSGTVVGKACVKTSESAAYDESAQQSASKNIESTAWKAIATLYWSETVSRKTTVYCAAKCEPNASNRGYSDDEEFLFKIGLAHIKNGDNWVEATPYVRVNDSWVEAAPYIRDGNNWREAI